MPHNFDPSLFSGANDVYLAEMYDRFCRDPSNVSKGWAELFAALVESPGAAGKNGGAEHNPGQESGCKTSWSDDRSCVIGAAQPHRGLSDAINEQSKANSPLEEFLESLRDYRGGSASADDISRARMDSIRAIMLIRAHRAVGHTMADLDPLKLERGSCHPDLDPANHGFSESDYDRPIFINWYLGLESATLRDILSICRRAYCGKVGVEFIHIQTQNERRWIQQQFEGDAVNLGFTELGKRTILERLASADLFESFLNRRFPGNKRFGLDGGESLVPMMEQIFKRGAQLGIEEVVIGMAHRGRLNVLANVMGKPYRAIFAEFRGMASNNLVEDSSGDVKYHLGTSADRTFEDRTIHLSLNPNPSHLEAVNTVVLGKVRAKQEQRGDTEMNAVMAILLHGDAAFIGQGIVAETFLLSQLRGYRTGGTIHIAVNNQIGFTTSPSMGRSSPYCSDMAKTVDAPVIHVNGDDPESCIRAARLAIEYRQKFKKDIVIDLWCYRRHGHNESDEPMFTQPLMYKKIATHPRLHEIYAQTLIDEGVITPAQHRAQNDRINAMLEEEYQTSETYRVNKADWLEGSWTGISIAEAGARRGDTGVETSLLREVGFAISQPPRNFAVNPKLTRFMEQRRQMINGDITIDWGMAEALAFGTLLCESTSIRLSGEDCQRGTFSHRHAVLIDQDTEDSYIPLNNIRRGQAPFRVIDSPLSEFGLLGYEYGYATAEPHALVLWEAQFGDFANGAQVIIDQFIASGETKWLRMCGLVMLLPHGYEGQGPEHSSARLERYLQLCAQDNWQVCNITTPANYFHALRRQARRSFRKPLVQMSPKSLLRHPLCRSKLEDFSPETSFHRVLWDDWELEDKLDQDPKIQRVILCSGKIYFDLFAARAEKNITNIYLLRLEQLYPFPHDVLHTELKRFPKAEIIWAQEETQNGGAWNFIDRQLEDLLSDIKHKASCRPRYIGRCATASPATGSLITHNAETRSILDAALDITPKSTPKSKPR